MNKRVFNPIGVRRGARPVLIHTGRTSGKTYRTPLDTHLLPDGYLFIPLYGPRTDWVKNVLTAQTARLWASPSCSAWTSTRATPHNLTSPVPAPCGFVLGGD